MRRWLSAVLMLLLLPLSACGGGETKLLQIPMAFRAELLNAEGCSFQADMQIRFEDCVYNAKLDCCCNNDGSAELTVLAPETIEGIRASFDGRKSRLEYDGVALDFGLPEDAEFAPIALPVMLARCWRETYILAAGQEEGLLRVSYEDDTDTGGFETDTWFDAALCPVYAEISLRGRVIAEITLTDFSLDGGEP